MIHPELDPLRKTVTGRGVESRGSQFKPGHTVRCPPKYPLEEPGATNPRPAKPRIDPLFVTMHTPLYAGEVRRLQVSFSAFDLQLLPVPITCRGSWLLNVQQKAEVIHRMLQAHPKRSIVWLDADARMQLYPELFFEFDQGVDFAAFFIPGVFAVAKRPWGPDRGPQALAGGTMYFGNTGQCRLLVNKWIVECQLHPGVWEQQNLQRALGHMMDGDSIDFRWLPQSYCKVFDCKWFPGEQGPVVIEHTQASRRLKRKVK